MTRGSWQWETGGMKHGKQRCFKQYCTQETSYVCIVVQYWFIHQQVVVTC